MSAVPSKAQLLNALDSLSYDARMAHVAHLAMRTADDPACAKLVRELLVGDAYEASLALCALGATRDAAACFDALVHPSLHVRRRAASLAARVAGDTDADRLRAALGPAAPEIRQRVLRQLARRRRTTIATQLLAWVLERWGARDAALLLPGANDACVRRHLPAVAHACRSLRRMAKNHPDALIDWMRSELDAAPQHNKAAVWNLMPPLWADLVRARPAAVLELARTHTPRDALPAGIEIALGRLLRTDPAGTAALLLGRPTEQDRLRRNGLPRPVLLGLRHLDMDSLKTIARLLGESPAHLAVLLARVAPSSRGALFREACPPNLAEGRAWPVELLAVLPHALRNTEAARMLGLREVRDDPQRTLEITAYRKPEAAMPELEPWTRASVAEDRARALTLALTCLRLYRSPVDQALQLLSRLKNEQDPVRLSAMTALARIPANRYAAAHTEVLLAIAGEVVAARDTSVATRLQLQTIALALLRAHASDPKGGPFQLGLELLHKLTEGAGMLMLPSLQHHLPKGAEHAFVDALLPRIRAATAREAHELALAVGRALGRRAWHVDVLQDLIGAATRSKPDWIAQQAMTQWLEAPKTREARVRQLLDDDLSTITVKQVWQHVTHDRQDWLDPFLEPKPIRGRFLTGQTIHVLPVRNGFHRWLPRQQRKFQAIHELSAGDPGHAASIRARAVATIARLLTTTLDDLEPWIARPEVELTEAALAALAWLDRQEGVVPRLLAFVEGDRARVAMYAVSKCARAMATPLLVAEIDELLAHGAKKVTTRKEAVRLLGAFADPEAVALLQSVCLAPGVHRDVRIAAGHAARKLLDVPRHADAGWTILERIASDPDNYVARSLLEARPLELESAARQRYGRLLLRVAAHEMVGVRQEAWTHLGSWSRNVEVELARAAGARVLDLSAGPEWRSALNALIAATRDGDAAPELEAVVVGLAGMPCPDAMNATRERDQPARQRLSAVVQQLVGLPGWNRLELSGLLSRMAGSLSQDPLTCLDGAWLRLACTPWMEPDTAAERLAGLALELQHEPAIVERISHITSSVLANPTTEWTPDAALRIVDTLLADGATATARLAIPVLWAASVRLSHRADCGERLRRLRAHPKLSVRLAALGSWTQTE